MIGSLSSSWPRRLSAKCCVNNEVRCDGLIVKQLAEKVECQADKLRVRVLSGRQVGLIDRGEGPKLRAGWQGMLDVLSR